jgi:hypothetical protein
MVLEAGVKFIADLTSAYVEAIRGAVDKIVDAFQAFVAWAIDFAWEVITNLISFAFDAIVSLGETLWNSLLVFKERAMADMATIGTISSITLDMFTHIFFGDLFLILTAAGIGIECGLLTIKAATLGVGFIIDIILMTLASYIVSEVIGAVLDAYAGPEWSSGGFLDWFDGVIKSATGNKTQAETGFTVFRSCWSILGVYTAAFAFEAGGKAKSFALSIITCILGFFNLELRDPVLTVILLGVSTFTLMKTALDFHFGNINGAVSILQNIIGATAGSMAWTQFVWSFYS